MRFDGEKNRLTSFKITIGNLKKIAAMTCATSLKRRGHFFKNSMWWYIGPVSLWVTMAGNAARRWILQRKCRRLPHHRAVKSRPKKDYVRRFQHYRAGWALMRRCGRHDMHPVHDMNCHYGVFCLIFAVLKLRFSSKCCLQKPYANGSAKRFHDGETSGLQNCLVKPENCDYGRRRGWAVRKCTTPW